MALAPISALSAQKISANYGSQIPPVRPAKKVEYEDKMVIPVEKGYNQIAERMQGQNNFYTQSLKGGTYGLVGNNIDLMA